MKTIGKNQHFWIGAVALIMTFGFFFSVSNYFQPVELALYSAIFDTLTMVITYHVCVRLVIPRFHQQGWKYLMVSFLTILLMSVIFYYSDKLFITRFHSEMHENPPQFFHFMRMFMSTSFVYFIATSISLFEHNQRLVEKERMISKEKLETELKLLKAQINPHFIFNALNNIYSLTYMQAKMAPDAVLKLSEMLRYVFYECNKDKVPISSEIKYIKNFIAFQQMKSDHTQNITLRPELEKPSVQIAPMLLIPLIENAFKYSRIEELEDAFAEISIAMKNKDLSISITNSIPDNLPGPGSGTGINNVKHRLAIIYPQKHVFTISDDGKIYKAELKLEVN